MDLMLEYHELPKEIRRYTAQEERDFFPRDGEIVLCIIDNEYKLVEFSWRYASFDVLSDGSELRHGRGESYWTITDCEETDRYDDGIYERSPDRRFPIKGWWRLPKVVGNNE